MLKKSARLPHLKGNKAPPVSSDSSEVARTSIRRYYPDTGNGGHGWCLSSSISLTMGCSTQDEAHEAHYHAGIMEAVVRTVIS